MRYKDMIGKKFGDLRVIKRSDRINTKRQTYWILQCGCGRFVEVRGDHLRLGFTTKCSVCHGAGKTSVFVDGEVTENGSL